MSFQHLLSCKRTPVASHLAAPKRSISGSRWVARSAEIAVEGRGHGGRVRTRPATSGPRRSDRPRKDFQGWAPVVAIMMLLLLTSCQHIPLQPHPLVGEGEPPGYIDGQIPARYRGVRNPFSFADPAALAEGSRLYSSYKPSCASCHGLGGQGDGPLWPRMEPMPPSFGAPPLLAAFRDHQDYVFWWVSDGVAKTVMPAYSQLTETQWWHVITLAWFLGEAAARNPINRDQYEVSRPRAAPYLRPAGVVQERP